MELRQSPSWLMGTELGMVKKGFPDKKLSWVQADTSQALPLCTQCGPQSVPNSSGFQVTGRDASYALGQTNPMNCPIIRQLLWICVPFPSHRFNTEIPTVALCFYSHSVIPSLWLPRMRQGPRRTVRFCSVPSRGLALRLWLPSRSGVSPHLWACLRVWKEVPLDLCTAQLEREPL